MTHSKLFAGLVIAIILLMPHYALCSVPVESDKWSQAPDMHWGMDFSSETKIPPAGSLVADDWLCSNGLPVTDIHWWGSFWTPNMGPTGAPKYSSYSSSFLDANPGGITSFTLTIYQDIPASANNPFSTPGALVWTKTVTSFNEQLFGTTDKGHKVYSYDVFLDQNDWFTQSAQTPTTFWLSIQANMQDATKQWGWHESNEHWNDAAVQDFKDSGWVSIENNAYKNDMAFRLTTTVPEPSGIMGLGASLMGLAGFVLRRRRV